LVVDAHGGIDRARQAVLSLAVAGRLVPQLSREGRGHDVLAEIRLQRDGQDIQGRSLNRKRDETASDDQAADPSFEIPANWCWSRLGEIAVKLGAGSTPLGGKSVYKRSGIKFLRSQNVWDSGLRLDDVAFIDQETHQRMEGTHVRPGDLLLNITGASIGRCAVVPDDFDEGNVSQHVAIVRLVDRDLRAFVHLCLISPYFQALIMGVQVGVSREGLSMKRLQDLQVPIPPVMEQKRIVAKVDQLMALCDDLEAKQTKKRDLATQSTRSALTALTTAESSAELSVSWRRVSTNFPSLVPAADSVVDLRGFVLSLAVQGKLTGRKRPLHDGGRFLKQIRERCLAEAKTRGIRSQDASPVCARDEPAPLPEGWNWARLGDLCFQITDGTHYTPTYVPAGMPFLSVKDVTGGKVDFSDAKYVTKEEHSKLTARCRPERNDVLLTKVGTTGVARVVDTDREFSIFVSLALLKFPHDLILPDYLCLFLNSPLARAQSERDTQGVGNKNLVLRFIRDFLVPLPPLPEQVEIVDVVRKLMSLLDDLEAKLRKQEETATRLAESLAAAVAA
jgi:type I restriction enzyme S subunit